MTGEGQETKGLGGGAFEHLQRTRFVCPKHRRAVECHVVQDVRTGQWKRVESCSAFDDPHQVTCSQECRRLLNLGFRMPGWMGV
jgi:hypothetical protein